MFLLSTIYLPFLCAFISAQSELVAVSLLHRHGDRTILSSYPNDPFKNASFWPVPYGELTNDGKIHLFNLGKWLRNRYSDFLSPKYLSSEFQIKSSDYDRCLMSAASNLAGLYPPVQEQVWNPSLPWQPIPVHTLPKHKDGMLAMEKPCSKREKLKSEVENSLKVLEFNAKHEDLFQFLSNNSGLNVTSYLGGYSLYDTLLVEEFFNYPLPEWTKSVFPGKLSEMAQMYFSLNTATKELAQFELGQYFDEILTQFDAKIRNGNMQKFKVYSAHDNNVYNILKNMVGKDFVELVPYNSMVIFELLRNKSEMNGANGKFYVRFYFKRGNEPAANLIKIAGCTSVDCDYDEFVKILKEYAMSEDEWDRKCDEKLS